MAAITIPVGAHILVGTPGISDPGDWRHALVLCAYREELFVLQAGWGGPDFTANWPLTGVRAIGDRAFLEDFRVKAAREVAELRKAVGFAEQAIGAARAAVWARLDEIGATRPGIEPAADRAARRRKRARAKIGLEEAA